MLFFALLALYFGLAVLFVKANDVPITFIPSGASCQEFTIPITITSENQQWTGPKWTNDYELIGQINHLHIFPYRSQAANSVQIFCLPPQPGLPPASLSPLVIPSTKPPAMRYQPRFASLRSVEPKKRRCFWPLMDWALIEGE